MRTNTETPHPKPLTRHSRPLASTVIVTLIALFLTACGPGSDASPEQGIEPPPDTPILALEGRVGAEALRDAEARLARGEFETVIRDARAVLEENPDSGLAYEVIGWAELGQARFAEATEAFLQATAIEPDQSGPWTKLGIVQMEVGDTNGALTSFRQALQIDDTDRFAHQRIGLVYEFEGDRASAIDHLQRGLEGTDPAYVGVAVNLARLLNEERRYQEAIDTLAPRLPIESDAGPLAHLILGTAYVRHGEDELAAERFERAEELDPTLDEARLGQAMAMRGAGNPSESLALLDQILAARPGWSAAVAERGTTLLALERFEEARDAYTQVLEAGDASPEIYAHLSELHLAAGRPADGEAVLRDSLTAFPNNPYLQFRLGTYLASLTRYREALPVLEQARDQVPNDPNVLRALSLAHMRLGDSAAAAAMSGRLYELLPRAGEGLLYATQLEASGRVVQAQGVYREVIELQPDNAVALNNLAYLLSQSGELDDAESLARRAVAVVPDNGQILDTLGWTLHLQGNSSESVETLARAVALQPEAATLRYHHGVALASAGQGADSRAALTEALRLDPDADWAADARSRLE